MSPPVLKTSLSHTHTQGERERFCFFFFFNLVQVVVVFFHLCVLLTTWQSLSAIIIHRLLFPCINCNLAFSTENSYVDKLYMS